MIKKKSYFKDIEKSRVWLENWVSKLEDLNGYSYEKQFIETSLGCTQVYGLNTKDESLPVLVIFPGFRTTSLVWDLDGGLKDLSKRFRLYLVETNGQPNTSDGNSPSIRSLDYGKWGEEVFDALKLEKAFIAGASFGGLVCMKVAVVIPERIESAFLLNPGCFRFVSFGWKNMYSNFLPIIKPSENNIKKFLYNVVFKDPEHRLKTEAEALLVDYIEFVLKNFKDRTEKPYYMNSQLDQVKTDVYMIVGTHDILLPYKKSVRRAQKHLGENLKAVHVLKAGHGIETYKEALELIKN